MKEEKIYFSINEVSTMLGLSKSTLRYWEEQFTQLNPIRRNGSPRRYYTQAHIDLIKQIKFMREEQNLPIENIVRILKTEKKGVDQKQRATDLLLQLREELLLIRDKI